MRELRRDLSNKWIAGVCSGIGEALNIDPTIIRIIWLLLTFAGIGVGAVIYIICWLVIPPKL